jgi:hypothetical protein
MYVLQYIKLSKASEELSLSRKFHNSNDCCEIPFVRKRTNTVELGYDIRKETEYFVSV